MTAPPGSTSEIASTNVRAEAFCPSCGAPIGGVECASCRTHLAAGARFCHACGAPAPRAPGRQPSAVRLSRTLPWAVAAVALLAAIALVVIQRFGAVTDGDGGVVPSGTPRGVVPAPDISSLTPSQRAERLYDRVMAAAERGRTDSVRFFMPMAIGAYEALGELTLDQRYDLGRLAEVSGDGALASAQADTILRKHPQHLLGLVLAARAARLRGDARSAQRYDEQLVRAEPAERKKQLAEYAVHQNDIEAEIARK
jgi:double zinc ribbon protein